MNDDAWTSWITEVRARLSSPAPQRLPPGDVRQAAVLVPLYVHAGELWTLLTKRSRSLPSHKGQIAFPGGGLEPGEDAWTAALREAEEEVGIVAQSVLRLGELDEAETPSGFHVVPYGAAGEQVNPSLRTGYGEWQALAAGGRGAAQAARCRAVWRGIEGVRRRRPQGAAGPAGRGEVVEAWRGMDRVGQAVFTFHRSGVLAIWSGLLPSASRRTAAVGLLVGRLAWACAQAHGVISPTADLIGRLGRQSLQEEPQVGERVGTMQPITGYQAVDDRGPACTLIASRSLKRMGGGQLRQGSVALGMSGGGATRVRHRTYPSEAGLLLAVWKLFMARDVRGQIASASFRISSCDAQPSSHIRDHSFMGRPGIKCIDEIEPKDAQTD